MYYDFLSPDEARLRAQYQRVHRGRKYKRPADCLLSTPRASAHGRARSEVAPSVSPAKLAHRPEPPTHDSHDYAATPTTAKC